MPSTAFTLCVPADDPYRGLVADVMQTYLKIADRVPAASTAAFIASIAAAVDRLAVPGADITVVVETTDAQVDVRVACGHATETLTHRS